MYARQICAMMIAACSLMAATAATVPELINYQGRLIDGTNLVNGSVSLSIGLYAAPSGGVLLYEDASTVVVVDGLYSTYIGDQTNSGNFASALTNASVYVEVVVNGTPLAPRERLVAVAYARMTEGLVVTPRGTVVLNAGRGGHSYASTAYQSVVGGGEGNTLQDAWYAVMAGGRSNRIDGFGDYGTIGGGKDHLIGANSANVVIGGGVANTVNTNSIAATIGGGANNSVQPSGSYAIIPGGQSNRASMYAFAAGRRAKADHAGSFVWGDATDADVSSTRTNQVTFRASGGFRVLGGAIEGNAGGLSNFPVSVLQNRSSAEGALSLSLNNTAAADFSFAGGGYGNSVNTGATYAVVAGGFANIIRPNADAAVIGGGQLNRIGIGSTNSAIVGGDNNSIEDGVQNAFIGGGGANRIEFGAHGAVIAGGRVNSIRTNASYVAIGGGYNNDVGWGSRYSVIAGGSGQQIGSNSFYVLLGGGQGNKVGFLSDYAAIPGGYLNVISNSSLAANIAGGYQNTIGSESSYASIGGGYQNTIGSNAVYATILGGSLNRVTAQYGAAGGRRAQALHQGSFVWADSQNADFISTTTNQFLVRASGGVGIGVANPAADLHVVSSTTTGRLVVAPSTAGSGGSSRIDWAEDATGTFGMRWLYDGGLNRFLLYGKSTTNFYGPHISVNRDNGFVGIGTNAPDTKLHVAGTVKADALELTGGADVAEPFDVSGDMVPLRGMVLCIDPASPGRLRVSDRAYDRTVAGVASGANDLPPGLVLRKKGSPADGAYPVALSGRVYCLVDADAGPVAPGDLLTTSARPGHAMRATDASRAQGAILGKAMTPLAEGQGLVLVLVTLQ